MSFDVLFSCCVVCYIYLFVYFCGCALCLDCVLFCVLRFICSCLLRCVVFVRVVCFSFFFFCLVLFCRALSWFAQFAFCFCLGVVICFFLMCSVWCCFVLVFACMVVCV